MPPPPPPPPGPAPLLTERNADPPKSSDDKSRSALLASIGTRAAPLKKTVTNDRSAPVIDGKKSGGPATQNGPRDGTTCGGSVPMGGLFQGGMPELRPTGSRPGNSGAGTGPLMPQVKKPSTLPSKQWQVPNADPPASNTIKAPSPILNNSQPPRKWNSVADNVFNRGQAPQPPAQDEKPHFGSLNNVAERNLQNSSRAGATSPLSLRPGLLLPNKPPLQTEKSQFGSMDHVAEQNLRNSSRGGAISPSSLRPGPPLPSKPPGLKRQNSTPGPSSNKPPPPAKGPPLINGPPAPAPPALPKRPADLRRPSSTEVNPSHLSSGAKPPPLPREASVPNLNQILSRALPAVPTRTREQPPPPPLPVNASRMQPPPPPPVSTLPRPQMGYPPTPKVAPSVRPPPPPTRNPTDSGTAGSVPPLPPHRVLANTLGRGNPPAPPIRNTSNRFSTIEDFESRFNFHNLADLPHPEPFSGAIKRCPSKNSDNFRKRDPPPPPPVGER